MKKIRQFSLLLTLGIILFSCTGTTKSDKPEKELSPQLAFFNQFKKFEGKKFLGKQVFIAEGMNSWAEEELEMFVRECSDTVVYVPFRVGNNTSRTWMFILENGETLRFRHNHRHADGTPEDLNLYGGYATSSGTEFMQIFPADDFTSNMLERIRDNEWTVEFSEDLNHFSYSLKKKGELVFKADFNLATAL
jgi:hypothetical protein